MSRTRFNESRNAFRHAIFFPLPSLPLLFSRTDSTRFRLFPLLLRRFHHCKSLDTCIDITIYRRITVENFVETACFYEKKKRKNKIAATRMEGRVSKLRSARGGGVGGKKMAGRKRRARKEGSGSKSCNPRDDVAR